MNLRQIIRTVFHGHTEAEDESQVPPGDYTWVARPDDADLDVYVTDTHIAALRFDIPHRHIHVTLMNGWGYARGIPADAGDDDEQITEMFPKPQNEDDDVLNVEMGGCIPTLTEESFESYVSLLTEWHRKQTPLTVCVAGGKPSSMTETDDPSHWVPFPGPLLMG